MSETHSIPQPAQSKPARPSKPYPDFPLFPHAAGVWAKKIRGRLHYFGPWSDPDGALKKYLEQKDALHAGRKPRETPEGFTVKDLANHFLDAKKQLVEGGELSPRTWTDYKEACDLAVSNFGKSRLLTDLDQEDFAGVRNKIARNWGPYRVGKMIQCLRCLFKYAYDADMIPVPIRYGPGFKRPSKKVHRLHRAKQGSKVFTAEEVKKLLDAAGTPMKAMILLGINCGFGNSDCGHLPMSAVNLETGWIDYPRPKTGIPRRCPLWPETVAALKESLAKRKETKNKADIELVFVTKYGDSWAKDVADSPITKEMRKILNAIGIHGHRNFYGLRHTFRTIADEVKDQPATNHIMGHEEQHMSTVYRETISDERLQAVVAHVSAWLFTPAK